MKNLIYDIKLLWPFIRISKETSKKKVKNQTIKGHKKKKDCFQDMFEDALSEASKSVSKTMGYNSTKKTITKNK